MNHTQADILIVAVIGILLLLIFGSPLKRRVLVQTEQQGNSSDSQSDYSPTAKVEIVSRAG